MLFHPLDGQNLSVQFPEPTRFGTQRRQVLAGAHKNVMQRPGYLLWLQSAVPAFGFREIEMRRHAFDALLSPGNLDTITNSSEHDIGKQSALTCCTNRVPVPPLLPGTLPAGRQSSVVLDRPWRKSGGQQRSPCGVAFVPGRQAFLVKQRIPVLGKPFHQREKVPVDRLRPLTFLLVGTQVPTFDPKLEAAPGHADFRLRGLAVIGVRSERQPQCELAGVPGKPLPSSAHLRARSIPVRPDVTPTYALLIEPLAPDAFWHSDPPDGVPVPYVRGMLTRTIGPALSCSVPRVVAQLALSQHPLRAGCIDSLRTKRAAASPLPGFLVLQAALVAHCSAAFRLSPAARTGTRGERRRPPPRGARDLLPGAQVPATTAFVHGAAPTAPLWCPQCACPMPAARTRGTAAGCRPGSCGWSPPARRRSAASARTASAPTPSRGRSSA